MGAIRIGSSMPKIALPDQDKNLIDVSAIPGIRLLSFLSLIHI